MTAPVRVNTDETADDPPATALIVRLTPGLYDKLIFVPARMGTDPFTVEYSVRLEPV